MTLDIVSFTKVSLPYGGLGNMAPYPVVFEGKTWRTSETLEQGLRFLAVGREDIAEEIRASKSPMGAKMVAKKNYALLGDRASAAAKREDLDRMRTVLRLKFEAHPALRAELLSTGDALLIEDVSARPSASGLYWGMARNGDGSWRGENRLGILLGELRSSLRNG